MTTNIFIFYATDDANIFFIFSTDGTNTVIYIICNSYIVMKQMKNIYPNVWLMSIITMLWCMCTSHDLTTPTNIPEARPLVCTSSVMS